MTAPALFTREAFVRRRYALLRSEDYAPMPGALNITRNTRPSAVNGCCRDGTANRQLTRTHGNDVVYRHVDNRSALCLSVQGVIVHPLDLEDVLGTVRLGQLDPIGPVRRATLCVSPPEARRRAYEPLADSYSRQRLGTERPMVLRVSRSCSSRKLGGIPMR